MEGQDHLNTAKLLLNLEKWLSPYTLKATVDPVYVAEIN
jgi:hypothetical protein